jgi:hypothetical protein
MCLRSLLSTMVVVWLGLAAAPVASGDAVKSSNWSGYAAHRAGVTFDRVSAAWTQPSATCTSGQSTFSSFWVGLGGYSPRSTALEQIGTEVDCTRFGRVRSSAWFELVPQASRTIRLKVTPGDAIAASVSVRGERVRVSLSDLTTRHTFNRTLRTRRVDVSSADWIVEAPSECVSYTSCETLPLANFGSATFRRAHAASTGGRAGTINGAGWRWTSISLSQTGIRYVTAGNSGPLGEALPSPLTWGGSSFSVAYSALAPQPATRRVLLRSVQERGIVH